MTKKQAISEKSKLAKKILFSNSTYLTEYYQKPYKMVTLQDLYKVSGMINLVLNIMILWLIFYDFVFL
jgi:hypothetical protein